jgi:hypothetical protein
MRIRIGLFLTALSVVKASKLSTMLAPNTFLQNAESPTKTGKFVVWNDIAFHLGHDGKFRMWQSSTQTWKDLTNRVFGLAPSLRLDAGFAMASDNFFLYGGSDANGNLIPASDSFYSFDPARSFSWSKLDFPVSEASPMLRKSFGFVSSGNKLYLFGGHAPWPTACEPGSVCSGCLLFYDWTQKRCMLNDLHEYSPETRSWKVLDDPDGSKPCERTDFSLSAGQGKLFLLGGITFRTNAPRVVKMAAYDRFNGCGVPSWPNVLYRLQDLWSYDIVSQTWTALATPVLDVGYKTAMVFHGNLLYAMGGINGNFFLISPVLALTLKSYLILGMSQARGRLDVTIAAEILCAGWRVGTTTVSTNSSSTTSRLVFGLRSASWGI